MLTSVLSNSGSITSALHWLVLLFFLSSALYLNVTDGTESEKRRSIIFANGLLGSKDTWILTKLKRGGIEIVKIAFVFILGGVIGYAIGSKEVSRRDNVHVEHRSSFRTGPPNPAWVDANEKEK